MSTAILKLSENGDLQRIHDKWLTRSACSSEGGKQGIDRLELNSFWGLFLLSGMACFVALLCYGIRMVYRFSRHSNSSNLERSSHSARLRSFLSFVNEREEEDKYRPKRRRREKCSCRKVVHEGGSLDDSTVSVLIENNPTVQH